MRIETREVASIRPYERNPRLNEGAVEAVARSLAEFGWRQPIVIDRDGVIVAGHTRLVGAMEGLRDRSPWVAVRAQGRVGAWLGTPGHIA